MCLCLGVLRSYWDNDNKNENLTIVVTYKLIIKLNSTKSMIIICYH